MTLQLMRFQSQNLYQVKSLLSDVRKIKKGSWKSCCFKQLFLPSVVWDSYIFLTSENNERFLPATFFKNYQLITQKGNYQSSLLLFDLSTLYKVIDKERLAMSWPTRLYGSYCHFYSKNVYTSLECGRDHETLTWS